MFTGQLLLSSWGPLDSRSDDSRFGTSVLGHSWLGTSTFGGMWCGFSYFGSEWLGKSRLDE